MTDRNDPPDKLPKPATFLAPEIVEALKIEGHAQININVLIQKVAEKTQSPETALQHVEAAIELSKNMKIIGSIRSVPGLEPSSTQKRTILTKSKSGRTTVPGGC